MSNYKKSQLKNKKIEEISDKILKKDKKLSHYIDNEKLLKEMDLYKKEYDAWEKLSDEEKVTTKTPKPSEYIGSCLYMLAERISKRPNFAGYSYREEMTGDAIENCLLYLKNFDSTKSKNPFAYFTQIMWFAFLRRIQKEKKQAYIKAKLFESSDKNGIIKNKLIDTDPEAAESFNTYASAFKLSETDINYFENSVKKKEKKNKKSKKGVDKLFE